MRILFLGFANQASSFSLSRRQSYGLPKPVRTVGSYWPYAPTLFDYIRRAMPQNAPQSLSNDDVYAVSAYILNLNGLLPADTTLGARNLGEIKMPNRNMFVSDPRRDVKNPACMTGC
jgi:S-disulfanyl-L-cysteine oxidoreductase SoxD